jgi:hypothetical protein
VAKGFFDDNADNGIKKRETRVDEQRHQEVKRLKEKLEKCGRFLNG